MGDGGRRAMGAGGRDNRRAAPRDLCRTEDSAGAAGIPTASAADAFLRGRRGRGCSPKTLAWYQTILRALGRRYALLPAEPSAIEDFLGELGDVSDQTRDAYWRGLRAFYRWAVGRLGVDDAMDGVGRPLRRRRVPPSLSEAEVLRVMAKARSGRDKALLTLLLDTGMRIGEAHSLRWANVGADHVTVTGKVGQREIPISDWTRWVLMGNDLPWRGRKGPLELNGMQKAVRRCLRRAGIEHGSCHILRHTFARLYLRAGGDVFSLQRIMGHADISTTRIYAELEMSDVRRQHRLFSPVVRLLQEAAG